MTAPADTAVWMGAAHKADGWGPPQGRRLGPPFPAVVHLLWPIPPCYSASLRLSDLTMDLARLPQTTLLLGCGLVAQPTVPEH